MEQIEKKGKDSRLKANHKTIKKKNVMIIVII
jgi:hypothetical protein